MPHIIPAIVLVWLIITGVDVRAGQLKIATYNVDNLFDAVDDGSEYPDYDPNGGCGWGPAMAAVKVANIARVLTGLGADIVCLQEVESRRALDLLLNKLGSLGHPYPHAAMADQAGTTVSCAVISKYPIISQEEISPGKHIRSILKVTVRFEGRPLILFVNHWKSKQGPESRRIVYAEALKKALDRLDRDSDYILIGDFNVNYDEFLTLPDDRRLNDTRGRTGINHVLGTISGRRLVTEADLADAGRVRKHYNLWLEVPAQRRWSHNFFGEKGTLDAILLPRGLYDDRGIAYVDNSFDRYAPDFLFDGRGAIYRWQQDKKGRGRHLGKGYSDHLPVFALFSTDPFQIRTKKSGETPRRRIIPWP